MLRWGRFPGHSRRRPHRRWPGSALCPGLSSTRTRLQDPGTQPNHSGQNLVARQATTAQIRLDAVPDQRQCLAETEHMLEFGFVTHLTPARMVAVLLAPAGIAPDRLEMAIRVGADPHLCPGRRDGERLETR